MPHYDYTCKNCEKTFEIFHKITEKPKKECPSCQKPALQRGFGGGNTAFRFIGEGFYVNDSKESCHGPCSDGKSPCCQKP